MPNEHPGLWVVSTPLPWALTGLSLQARPGWSRAVGSADLAHLDDGLLRGGGAEGHRTPLIPGSLLTQLLLVGPLPARS